MLAISGIELNPGPGPEICPSQEIPISPVIPPFLFGSQNSLHSLTSDADSVGRIADLDDSDLDSVPVSTNNYPVFFSANVNSLTSKLELGIKPLIEHYKFPLLAIQESKLDSTITDNEICIPDYLLFRKDRTRNGGGVCLYVHKKLRPKLVKFRSAPDAEIIAVVIKFRRCSFLIASIYKPPTTPPMDFVSNLSDFLAEAVKPKYEVLLFGDTNVDALRPEFIARFGHFMATFRLQQFISEATHKGHCIDHLFATNRQFISQIGTGPPIENHHSYVWSQLCVPELSVPKSSFVHWDWESADWDHMKFDLSDVENGGPRDWETELSEQPSVHAAAVHLQREILLTQMSNVPHKDVTLRRNSCPWFSRSIRRCIERKNKQFRSLQRSNNPSTRAKYRRANKKAKAACLEAKKNSVKEAFEAVKGPQDFWKTVKKFSGTNTSGTTPPLQKSDGSIAFSASEKAAALSAEFKKNFNSCDIAAAEIPVGIVQPDWFCEEEEIQYEISRLQSNAAVGLDGISARTLKYCSDQLVKPLVLLLNRCLRDCEYPDAWKMARISPIPKIPGADATSDFRPISVLPILDKIAERWIKRIMTPSVFGKTSWNQFAFTPGRAVEDAIGLLQFYVSAGFNSCPGVTRVAIVSLDIRKAFDTVPVNKLIHILRHNFQLPDALASLVRNYLMNRVQVTRIDGEDSFHEAVSSGVPQGSVLGPHLFNSYVSGVLNSPVSEGTRLLAFADDLLIVKPLRNDSDIKSLQDDIDAIISAYGELFLTVNPKKSAFMICTLATPAVCGKVKITLEVNGDKIEQRDILKYLGVTIDPDLSMGSHTEITTPKAKRAIGAFWRVLGKYSSRGIFFKFYKTKILPVLLHALPTSMPVQTQHWKQLEKINRFACRLVANDFTSTYQNLLERLHWKPISQLAFERQMIMMFKYAFAERYFPVEAMRPKPPHLRVLRHRNYHQFQFDLMVNLFATERVPQRQNVGKCPIFFAVHSWNSLPRTIQNTQMENFNSSTFKLAIKNPVMFSWMESAQAAQVTRNPCLERHYNTL